MYATDGNEQQGSRSQLHAQHLMHSQRLPDTQIQHNLLTTTRDGVSANVPVQSLDLCTLTSAGVTQTTEDLTGLTSAELKSGGRLGLETCDRTTKLEHSLHVAHAHALVDNGLEPGVRGFNLSVHVCQLQSNDGVLDQLLAECLALVGVFDGLFVADSREAQTLDDDADTLVARKYVSKNIE